MSLLFQLVFVQTVFLNWVSKDLVYPRDFMVVIILNLGESLCCGNSKLYEFDVVCIVLVLETECFEILFKPPA